MTKTIVFDSGTIISFADNCLLWVLRSLKEKEGLELVMPSVVEFETITHPERVAKHELNALRIQQALRDGTFTIPVNTQELAKATQRILRLANDSFKSQGQPLEILHAGEAQAMALVGLTDARVFAVDEKTARMILEEPLALRKVLEDKLQASVTADEATLRELHKAVGECVIVRSTELVAWASKKGLLEMRGIDSRQLLKASLYAMKYNGCSVSFKEIEDYTTS